MRRGFEGDLGHQQFACVAKFVGGGIEALHARIELAADMTHLVVEAAADQFTGVLDLRYQLRYFRLEFLDARPNEDQFAEDFADQRIVRGQFDGLIHRRGPYA